MEFYINLISRWISFTDAKCSLCRTEIDRLTELLRSKAVDMPMGDEEKRDGAIQLRPALDSSSSLLEENRSVKVISGGYVATPVTNSRVRACSLVFLSEYFLWMLKSVDLARIG